MVNQYQTEEEIKAVVDGFESCSFAKDKFTHREHLTVAVWYLRNSTEDQAFQKMRSGLLRFLAYHEIARTKYNEQLTLSWLSLIHDTIEQMNPADSLVDVTNAVIERLGNSRITVASLVTPQSS